MSEQGSFASATYSACVERARQRLCLRQDAPQDIALRAITFATHTGSESEGWWGLKDHISGSVAGEVCFCRIRSRTDPVQGYVCVRLSSGALLEAVEFASAPRITHLFARGTALGRMIEEQLPRDASWWRRIIGGKRIWQVFLRERMIGSVDLNYPLDKNSRLLLQTVDGTSLPIGLASVWGREETRFVIPPDAPRVNDDLEALHFLLVIVFRILLQLDFCTS